MPDQIINNPDPAAYAAMPQNQDAIYRMISGANPGELREMVRALGGPKAVAPLVGRHHRTVERWITTATERIGKPRADARQALDQAFGQARTTRSGRERIAASRRATLMRGHGATMRGSALCGPYTPGGERGYPRRRSWTDYRVDSATVDATWDAYIQGGEEAAYLAFNKGFGDEYGGGGMYFDNWLFFDMGGLGFAPDVGPGQ